MSTFIMASNGSHLLTAIFMYSESKNYVTPVFCLPVIAFWHDVIQITLDIIAYSNFQRLCHCQ